MVRPTRQSTNSLVADHSVAAIFSALGREGEEARIVGGAVRDALLGLPVGDVDFATTATPDKVERLAREAGIKVVPTGIEHGTLTLVAGGRGFEVTTLRQDIETDGRHAVVRFGRDWQADALRRDFTINALFLDAAGTVHDYVGGRADAAVRRVRFIGDPDVRIAEDRLRILRFFRFHATLGLGTPDPAGLSAAIRARHGLASLSAERIGQEMRKLAVGVRAADAVEAMQDSGILPLILAGVGRIPAFRRLSTIETRLRIEANAATRLLVLACRVVEDVERLTGRLRLTNLERGRMEAALRAAPRLHPGMSGREARRALYRLETDAFRDAAVLRAALGPPGEGEAWASLFSLPERAPVPGFPISGRDIVAAGVRAGPAVGEALRTLEDWWIAEDFRPDAESLRRRLQQWVQSSQ